MRSLLKAGRDIVGPTAVIAAGTMGAGSVASLILAGAWFRYELLWVILLTLPLFVVSVDSASRIGALNRGSGMFSIIRQHLHPGLAWTLLIINVPVHILVSMGQISVMSSAFLSLLGIHPPGPAATQATLDRYQWLDITSSIGLACVIVWVILSHGYARMQRAMTGLMILMFFSFLVIALRSVVELPAILVGFLPSLPADLPVEAGGSVRMANSSIIAIIGSAIAPGALLTIPYMSSDATSGVPDMRRGLRASIINLGLVYGAYAVFVLVAGGYALYPLSNHAGIETVHEAGQVLTAAFPAGIGAAGPFIFSLGLFTAAMTTLVVAVQMVIYFSLDACGRNWSYTESNRLYRRLLTGVVLLCAVLAPLWSFPALLKVILLMGINVVVIPLVIIAVIYLVNCRAVMGEHTASPWRNGILVACLLVSIILAVIKTPDFIRMFST